MNFDYCEVCEERLNHDHPFIKITKPENAPTRIVTGINEEDKEADYNQQNPFFNMWQERMKHKGFPFCFKGGPGGKFKHHAKKWIDIANNFVNNMPDEEETKEGEPRHWGGWRFGGEGGCDRQKWGEKRAVILRKPEEPVVG